WIPFSARITSMIPIHTNENTQENPMTGVEITADFVTLSLRGTISNIHLTMPKVAVIPEPNAPVEIREVAQPELEHNSALLDVECSEVCGTDVYLHRGGLDGVPYPLVPGHVSVGRLSKIRGQLIDVDGRPFREGDRVTFLDVHRTCNAC